MEIFFAGDFSLQGRWKGCRDASLVEQALGEPLKDLLRKADHAVINWEGASTPSMKGILKDGPCLKNAPEVLPALKSVGFDIVTLANNHVGDYSFEGVMDTIRACQDAGLKTVGAGSSLAEASAPLILEDDCSLAILNVCESEALIATPTTPGLAPIDLISLFNTMNDLRAKVDFIIIVVHGGCEHYPLPTPEMQRRYRYFVDLGADAVVGHHQHCFSGYEVYNGKPIFYGLGNFFFDGKKGVGSAWNEGYLVQLTLGKEMKFELHPYRQCGDDLGVVLLGKDYYSDQIQELNAIIVDEGRLQEEFDKFVGSKRPLSVFLPYSNHYLTELYIRRMLPACLSERKLAKMISRIKCEAHNEVLRRSFSPDYLMKKEKV